MTPLAARRLDTMGALALRLAAVELSAPRRRSTCATGPTPRAGHRPVHALVRESVPFVRTGQTVPANLDGLTARLVEGLSAASRASSAPAPTTSTIACTQRGSNAFPVSSRSSATARSGATRAR